LGIPKRTSTAIGLKKPIPVHSSEQLVQGTFPLQRRNTA